MLSVTKPNLSEYLKINEAAEYLGVSTWTLRNWDNTGKLKTMRHPINGYRIYRHKDLEALLQNDDSDWYPNNSLAANSDWEDIGESEHFVQFYESSEVLVNSVSGFIATALEKGEGGVIVATAAHREDIEEKLKARGIDIAAAIKKQQYICLDAAQTLAKFMVDGAPDQQLFNQLVGEVFTQISSKHGHLRAFGEMVAILWEEGNKEAAITLEKFWNELRTSYSFSLFCAYPLRAFAESNQEDLFGSICGCHSKIIPAESYDTNMTPKERLVAISRLQQKASSLEAEIEHRKEVEKSLVKREEELQQTQKDLQVALEKAQSANIAKTEFLTNMSHEIRTPMNAVIGLVHILGKSKPLTAKQAEFIETLQLSADSLLSLINDLLDISKIESRTIELENIPFSLTHLIQEVISIMSVRTKEKGLTFTTDAQFASPHLFMGDSARLRQIILNLCSNAMKFTDEGGVHISITSESGEEDDTEIVRIAVKDSGIGIPSDRLEDIFQKFVQADTSISRKYGGTGLGLTITKTLIEIMGGTISVESTLGEGSIFTVNLPLKITKEEQPKLLSQIIQSENSSDYPHVLLVEDYAANILVATTFLEQSGYSYDLAKNGIEAVERAKQGNYIAVLMDVQMHGMDGFEATRQIREYEKNSGKQPALIIGMTAHALAGDRERCISAGMNDYISKPFDHESLRKKLALASVRALEAA